MSLIFNPQKCSHTFVDRGQALYGETKTTVSESISHLVYGKSQAYP